MDNNPMPTAHARIAVLAEWTWASQPKNSDEIETTRNSDAAPRHKCRQGRKHPGHRPKAAHSELRKKCKQDQPGNHEGDHLVGIC